MIIRNSDDKAAGQHKQTEMYRLSCMKIFLYVSRSYTGSVCVFECMCVCVLDTLFLHSLLPPFHSGKGKENLSDEERGEPFLSHLSPTET